MAEYLSVDEIKSVELEIMTYFASFCEKHNLSYFLYYGTLIGAIRHEGFIPWDDDVDFAMPRKDYDRLIGIFNKEKDTDRYYLVAPNDDMSRHCIVKIIDTRTVKKEGGVKASTLGVDIDVFALDGIPSVDKTYDTWYNKLIQTYSYHLNLVSETPKQPKSFLKHCYDRFRILQLYASFDKKKVLADALRMHGEYPYDKCEYVGVIECSDNGKKNRVKKEWFDGYVLKPFEDKMFRVPVGYDNILTAIYGDYMNPPPVAHRESTHTNNVKWKE